MALVDNADGDALTADDAEQRVVEELQLLGREALQCWAQRAVKPELACIASLWAC